MVSWEFNQKLRLTQADPLQQLVCTIEVMALLFMLFHEGLSNKYFPLQKKKKKQK